MAFSLKTWVNRISEYPNRRKLTHEDGSTELVTVARAEGQISAEGNAFSAEEMNDLENRIKGGFEEVTQSLGLLNEGIQAVSKKQNFCKGSDRLLTDVLIIDFTNPTGESNSYGVIATEDASKLLNSPVTDGAFYAYREVLTIKSAPKDYKVIVRLTEAYPSPGRTWIKAYNPNISDWSDWKVI